MLKTILSQVKEFKRVSILTPVFVLGEVILEMVIPLLMASIIDEGVTAGNIDHIKTTGLWMLLLAVVSLCLGLLSARFGVQASAGLARNLRQAMFEKIQTYSFSNIDKFSTSSLITRLTTDVTNVQNAYMMILRMCSRAPASRGHGALLLHQRRAGQYLPGGGGGAGRAALPHHEPGDEIL